MVLRTELILYATCRVINLLYGVWPSGFASVKLNSIFAKTCNELIESTLQQSIPYTYIIYNFAWKKFLHICIEKFMFFVV